jgi:hypothetical protein
MMAGQLAAWAPGHYASRVLAYDSVISTRQGGKQSDAAAKRASTAPLPVFAHEGNRPSPQKWHVVFAHYRNSEPQAIRLTRSPGTESTTAQHIHACLAMVADVLPTACSRARHCVCCEPHVNTVPANRDTPHGPHVNHTAAATHPAPLEGTYPFAGCCSAQPCCCCCCCQACCACCGVSRLLWRLEPSSSHPEQWPW